jgi:hypothetical protein
MDAEITFRIVDAPASRWCSSGHRAPETFKRVLSADGLEEPTKFYEASGDIQGCYCEPCVIIAKWMADQQKQLKRKARKNVVR